MAAFRSFSRAVPKRAAFSDQGIYSDENVLKAHRADPLGSRAYEMEMPEPTRRVALSFSGDDQGVYGSISRLALMQGSGAFERPHMHKPEPEEAPHPSALERRMDPVTLSGIRRATDVERYKRNLVNARPRTSGVLMVPEEAQGLPAHAIGFNKFIMHNGMGRHINRGSVAPRRPVMENERGLNIDRALHHHSGTDWVSSKPMRIMKQGRGDADVYIEGRGGLGTISASGMSQMQPTSDQARFVRPNLVEVEAGKSAQIAALMPSAPAGPLRGEIAVEPQQTAVERSHDTYELYGRGGVTMQAAPGERDAAEPVRVVSEAAVEGRDGGFRAVHDAVPLWKPETFVGRSGGGNALNRSAEPHAHAAGTLAAQTVRGEHVTSRRAFDGAQAGRTSAADNQVVTTRAAEGERVQAPQEKHALRGEVVRVWTPGPALSGQTKLHSEVARESGGKTYRSAVSERSEGSAGYHMGQAISRSGTDHARERETSARLGDRVDVVLQPSRVGSDRMDVIRDARGAEGAYIRQVRDHSLRAGPSGSVRTVSEGASLQRDSGEAARIQVWRAKGEAQAAHPDVPFTQAPEGVRRADSAARVVADRSAEGRQGSAQFHTSQTTRAQRVQGDRRVGAVQARAADAVSGTILPGVDTLKSAGGRVKSLRDVGPGVRASREGVVAASFSARQADGTSMTRQRDRQVAGRDANGASGIDATRVAQSVHNARHDRAAPSRAGTRGLPTDVAAPAARRSARTKHTEDRTADGRTDVPTMNVRGLDPRGVEGEAQTRGRPVAEARDRTRAGRWAESTRGQMEGHDHMAMRLQDQMRGGGPPSRVRPATSPEFRVWEGPGWGMQREEMVGENVRAAEGMRRVGTPSMFESFA